MKPFPTYFGGKEASGVPQVLINHIPPHTRYISATVGNDAVARYKLPAEHNIFIDIDKAVIDAWQGFKFDNGQIPQLYNTDAIAWLRQNAKYLSKDDFVYIDPPYLEETRTSGTKYNHEFTREQHIQLLEVITKLPCMVGITHYANELYNEALKAWDKVHFISKTRGYTAIDTLYMNYPAPTALHDYRYLGEGFRERERIRRKVKRWANGLLRLPELEMKAILSEISKISQH